MTAYLGIDGFGFAVQSIGMETDWAAENLRVIRTLMERSAVYRRALAPLMGAVGLAGVAAAIVAPFAPVRSPRAFAGYWMAVAAICLAGAFLLIRRQALNDAEPFWSPPTRRAAQALSPAFFAGFAPGLMFLCAEPRTPLAVGLLVPGWMVLYGCGVHAAGFFMPRGFKLFGWLFIAGGCVLGAAMSFGPAPALSWMHWAMGVIFGGSHLAYGIYLYFTEKHGNAT